MTHTPQRPPLEGTRKISGQEQKSIEPVPGGQGAAVLAELPELCPDCEHPLYETTAGRRCERCGTEVRT